MEITFNIDTDKIINELAKLPIDEKVKLYRKIKSEIRKYQIESLMAEFKTDDISEEEINEIVEQVRTEEYKNRS
jgi:hypothetical protein